MYDLVISGGTVIDPATDSKSKADVAVVDGRIAAVAESIDTADAREVVDATGHVVVPGIIDLHAHVFHGVNANGIDPDIAGVRSGVATVVDGGSAGSANFRAFPNYVIPKAVTEIVPFIHIGKFGVAAHPDIYAKDSISVDDTIKIVAESDGLIQGVKVRLVSPALDVFGLDLIRLAREVASEFGIGLLVHIGDNTGKTDPSIISRALPLLEKGDILTHLYTPNPGGVLDADGRPVPELAEAHDRGVILDTAHGDVNFSLDVARRALDAGVVPDCISTDLNLWGWNGVAPGMPDIMSRFLALGFSLREVLEMCTVNPARALRRDQVVGRVAPGYQADISILDVRSGDWVLRDNFGGRLRASQAVVPVGTVKRGVLYEAGFGPRAWGWEPEQWS